MDWKEFFKIDKIKLVVTIILAAITFFIWNMLVGAAMSGNDPNFIIMIFYYILLLPRVILTKRAGLFLLLVEAIYLYLVSCILIFLLKIKVDKKK